MVPDGISIQKFENFGQEIMKKWLNLPNGSILSGKSGFDEN